MRAKWQFSVVRGIGSTGPKLTRGTEKFEFLVALATECSSDRNGLTSGWSRVRNRAATWACAAGGARPFAKLSGKQQICSEHDIETDIS